MIIRGVDYHPEFQQIALLDKDTGEFQEKRLTHPEEAEPFYRALAGTGQKVRVGMEASGHAGLVVKVAIPQCRRKIIPDHRNSAGSACKRARSTGAPSRISVGGVTTSKRALGTTVFGSDIVPLSVVAKSPRTRASDCQRFETG
jgi:hypothetical protein